VARLEGAIGGPLGLHVDVNVSVGQAVRPGQTLQVMVTGMAGSGTLRLSPDP